jgi:hypothetical protein
METPTEKGYCATCGRSADDVLYNGHADHCYPTPPPAALTPERRTEERWVYSADQTERTMVPPPARAEAPEGEIEAARDLIRRDAEFQAWAQSYLDSGKWAGHDRSDAVKQELLARDAEVSRLTEALEQAQRDRDAALEKVDELLECPSFQCPYEKRMRAAEAERDQQAGALGRLLAEVNEAADRADARRADSMDPEDRARNGGMWTAYRAVAVKLAALEAESAYWEDHQANASIP